MLIRLARLPCNADGGRVAEGTDIVDKAAYMLANPAAAGLVRSGRQWPGLWSGPERIGGDAFEITRPRHFFDPKGALPDNAFLQVEPPPGFTAEEFRDGLCARLAAREAAAAEEFRSGFLGVARVLSQKPTGQPRPGEPRRGLNPRIAARDKWKRIEALGRLLEFLRDYRSAWTARREGDAGAVFPCGTYLLRVAHGVACAGSG